MLLAENAISRMVRRPSITVLPTREGETDKGRRRHRSCSRSGHSMQRAYLRLERERAAQRSDLICHRTLGLAKSILP